ncbi:MAG: hypothetical protein QGD94_09595, partial [Planctomycetia bacterium]|nr:hypothetical protein [Planctomycetia bacterium]
MKTIAALLLLVALSFVLAAVVFAQAGTPEKKAAADLPPEVKKHVEKLNSSDPKERALAALALGKMGPKAIPAIPHLIKQLGDMKDSGLPRPYSPRDVAEAASPALAQIGTPAIPPLIKALGHK